MNRIWYGMMLATATMLSAKPLCKLNKVFHNREPKADTLKLGNIVLYCTDYPTVEPQEAADGGTQKIRYMMNNMEIPSQAQTMVDAFNASASPHYKASLISYPEQKKVALIITYDPRKIVITHEDFEAITHDKAVVFHVWNQALLESLQEKEINILKVSYAKPTIIIDCGHGGSDTGTVGVNRAAEKDVVLQVGKLLECELKNQGFTVCMTRVTDEFVPLDERTTRSNTCDMPALFISLHANSAPKATAQGIETYCLDSGLFTTMGLQTSLDVVINPLKDAHYHLGQSLAKNIHQSVLDQVRTKYPDVTDRKVRHAGSVVLVGTGMPATLIELGFLSHAQEADRLVKKEYQSLLSHGICNGIKNFIASHS